MKRFPERYVKPELLSLHRGCGSGWTAACNPGTSASSGCSSGSSVNSPIFNDSFDPRYIEGTRRNSGLLTD